VFIPPPLFFAVGLGIAWWLEGRWSLPMAAPSVWLEMAGALLVVVSMVGALWAAGRFGRAGTPLVPVKAATALVTDGPFRHSRNPMYLSLTVGYVGVSLIINTWWPLVLLPVVLLVMRLWVIAREEAYLAKRFGEKYADYCRRVRRWL
jgi:protein-S-isoprenylcysteine O-methyltransferase Ste14